MQSLSDKFCVAISNVDLSKDIDQRLFDEIVGVFVKKQVLVCSSSSRAIAPFNPKLRPSRRIAGPP
jgi:hypothetical protein